MVDETKNFFDVIFSTFQLIIILSSAVWAYFRFRKEDPLHPRIEFDIQANFLGPQHHTYLTTFTISANNKGNVEHRFEEILLRVRGIKADQPLTTFEKYPPMVSFPEPIMRETNIIPINEDWGYFFVRPNINQNFNYVIQVPSGIKYILVHVTFKYSSSIHKHSAERVFEVKAGQYSENATLDNSL